MKWPSSDEASKVTLTALPEPDGHAFTLSLESGGGVLIVSSVNAAFGAGAGGEGAGGDGAGGEGAGGEGAGDGVVHQVPAPLQLDREADVSLFWHQELQSAAGRCCGHQQQ